MYQDEQIIEQLGISELPQDEQAEIVNEAQVRIGELISSKLTEEQVTEYQAIIDGNDEIISSWLEKSIPDYKNQVVYQAFAEGVEADPEHNDPAKLFASIAWVQLTVPDIQNLVAEALEAFKQELAVR